MFERKTDIYVFSGTGNTLLVARKMRDTFVGAGREAALHLMERVDPAQIDISGNIGLAFPVAAQSTYPLVWEFCHNLPQSEEGTPVFMVDTLGSFSGGIVGPLKKLLLRKGYKAVGACEIIMPNNFLCRKIDGAHDKLLIDKGLIKAESFANELMCGKARWQGLPLLSGIFRLTAYLAYPKSGGLMRRMLTPKVERDKCVRCGLCAKVCPVGNISQDSEKYPVFSNQCLVCMRCFGMCPHNALRVRSAKAYFAPGINKIEE